MMQMMIYFDARKNGNKRAWKNVASWTKGNTPSTKAPINETI
jgi:hypothetical protein